MPIVPDLHIELGATPYERDVLRVWGPEAVDFLQGQLSQDVAALAVGSSAPSLLLQPTGKVDAWLRATRLADDELLLDVDAGHGGAVEARLRRFRLRTKADIELSTWHGFAVRGPGSDGIEPPEGVLALPAAWPGVEAVDLLAPEPFECDLPEAASGALESLRIERGVPAMGAELTDATIPAEAGQWLIDASVSFTKGCYTGQELVARVDSRGGNVPRPLRGLRSEGDTIPVAATLHLEGSVDESRPVGTVTSSAPSPLSGSLAMGPLSRTVEPGSAVLAVWDGGQARAVVSELPLR